MRITFRISHLIVILVSIFWQRTVEAVNKKFSLSTFIQPIHYRLELFIDVPNEWPNYEENVQITVKCVEQATNEISLNVKRSDLIITEGKVRVKLFESNPEVLIGVQNHNYDTENDIHTIQLSTFLEVDEIYEVLIPFQRLGSYTAKGFSMDEHEDVSKNGQEFIVTQLGPADTRGIYPSLDQINLKATFKVFLKHSEHFWAFSNMKKVNTKNMPGFPNWVEDEFDESPLLSTNNIGFALIDSKMFKLLDSSVDGPIQLYATETAVSSMEVAYITSRLAMDFFSDFFESQYASSNLNMIVLPNFQDKDKEAYGIITLQDSSLLFSGLFDTALYICHVMSHQWLGTRVSVSSWSIYWLLEAFVYLLEKPCLEHVLPEQKFSYFDTLIVKIFMLLLPYEVEGLSYTMLDSDNYFHSTDTYTMNDPILAKGFCLVRMLNFAFGEELLRKSMASYVKMPNSMNSSLQYVGDTFTEVITESKTFAYPIDVNKFMNSWISKPAYPQLTVTRTTKGNAVKITQKNFRLYYDPDKDLIFDNKCWIMPLRITTNKDMAPDNNQVHHWIDCHKPFKIDINADKNDWMILDLRLNVLCHVNYDKANWDSINSLLRNPDEYFRIHTLSRVQLILDMFAFSDTGTLTYDWVLETMKFLVHENSYLPMNVAANELLRIRERLLRSEIFPLFKEYVRKIVEVKFDKQAAGIIEDPSQTINEQFQFERLIIKLSCMFGVQECKQLGKRVFKEWLDRTDGTESEEVEDDREAFYCQAMKTSTEEEWTFLWNKYNVKQEKKFNSDILRALGCSCDKIMLNNYLRWSIKTTQHQISPEDSPIVFESLAMNEEGYPLMKKFVSQRFEEIKTFLNGSSISIDIYLKKLLDITTTAEDLKDLLTIIQNNYGNNNNDFEVHVKKAERNIWWLNKYVKALSLYFKPHVVTQTSESEQKLQ